MDKLIFKAKEKGFVTKVINEYSLLNGTAEEEETYGYLYLSELKKWLMDEHKIYVTTEVNDITDNSHYVDICSIADGILTEHFSEVFESETQALIQGLTKTIELI